MHTHYRGSPNFRREGGRECQNRPHALKMEHTFPKVHSSTIYKSMTSQCPVTLVIIMNFMICGRRTQHAVIQLDLYTQLLQVLGYQILYTDNYCSQCPQVVQECVSLHDQIRMQGILSTTHCTEEVHYISNMM